jgi:hypothetical protein
LSDSRSRGDGSGQTCDCEGMDKGILGHAREREEREEIMG